MNQARRRQFPINGGAFLATPLPGFAQGPATTMPRIGFLGVSTPAAWTPRVDAFWAGLRDLGYVEGRNIVIEFRFAQGQYDHLPDLAAELVRLRVAVLANPDNTGMGQSVQAMDVAAYEDGFTLLELTRKYYREAGLDARQLDLLIR